MKFDGKLALVTGGASGIGAVVGAALVKLAHAYEAVSESPKRPQLRGA